MTEPSTPDLLRAAVDAAIDIAKRWEEETIAAHRRRYEEVEGDRDDLELHNLDSDRHHAFLHRESLVKTREALRFI